MSQRARGQNRSAKSTTQPRARIKKARALAEIKLLIYEGEGLVLEQLKFRDTALSALINERVLGVASILRRMSP